MVDSLWVWAEDTPVGRFDRTDKGIIFTYDEAAPQTPISLSLNRNGGWTRRTPERFLDNLLPDSEDARRAMMVATGAKGTDSFSLLDGADSTGGLVFTSKPEPPDYEHVAPVIATQQAIAYRIATMRESKGTWWEEDDRIRFSLAGNQPKFALARIGNMWTWSDATNPSTHILKPSQTHVKESDVVEAASMKLAGLCGVDVPRTGLETFGDSKKETAYITERFDRYRREDGSIGRIHTEDMLQSLALPPKDKYHVKAKQILAKLHEADPTDNLSYQWIKQVALNVSISNADAHAKNYSLILRPEGIQISPMYDVLTTTYWPKVSRDLPMSIGGATGANMITPYHWQRFADDNNLDPDKVEQIARVMAGRVIEASEEAYEGLPADMKDRLFEELEKANERIDPLYDEPLPDEETANGKQNQQDDEEPIHPVDVDNSEQPRLSDGTYTFKGNGHPGGLP